MNLAAVGGHYQQSVQTNSGMQVINHQTQQQAPPIHHHGLVATSAAGGYVQNQPKGQNNQHANVVLSQNYNQLNMQTQAQGSAQFHQHQNDNYNQNVGQNQPQSSYRSLFIIFLLIKVLPTLSNAKVCLAVTKTK